MRNDNVTAVYLRFPKRELPPNSQVSWKLIAISGFRLCAEVCIRTNERATGSVSQDRIE